MLTAEEKRRRGRERKARWREKRRAEGLPVESQRRGRENLEKTRESDRLRKAKWRESRRSAGLSIVPEKEISGECAVYPRACDWCGDSFIGKRRNARFCSTTCRTRFKDSSPASKARHDGGHRGRARHYGVPYEPVNRQRVFERDEYVCGICGGWVPREEASLDHIVPMSKGGPHSYANTQCSHLACNIAKGAKVVVESGGRNADVRRGAAG